MEDYFAGSKYRISNQQDEDPDQEADTDYSLFGIYQMAETHIRFFNSFPKQVLQDGSKIFNKRLFL